MFFFDYLVVFNVFGLSASVSSFCYYTKDMDEVGAKFENYTVSENTISG